MQFESSPPIFIKCHWMPKTKSSHAFEENMTIKEFWRLFWNMLWNNNWENRESSNNKNIPLTILAMPWNIARNGKTEAIKMRECGHVSVPCFHHLSSICFNFHCISRFFHEWNHFLIAGGAPTAVCFFSHMIGWCCWYISEMDITSPFHKTLNVNQPVTYFAETTTCRWGGLIRKILAFLLLKFAHDNGVCTPFSWSQWVCIPWISRKEYFRIPICNSSELFYICHTNQLGALFIVWSSGIHTLHVHVKEFMKYH